MMPGLAYGIATFNKSDPGKCYGEPSSSLRTIGSGDCTNVCMDHSFYKRKSKAMTARLYTLGVPIKHAQHYVRSKT